MQRLAQVGLAAEASDGIEWPPRASMGIFFLVGLFGGALVGGAALLALQMLVPARLYAVGDSAAAFTASLAPWNWASLAEPAAKAPANQPAPTPIARQDRPDVFEVTIDRAARAHAAFGLRLVGAHDQSLQILVRDVPAGAVLSHGERRDASTWSLKPADLKDLYLALNDGTPDAFDLKIDVLAWSGVAAGSSVARVRLVAAPASGEAAVAALERAPRGATPRVADVATDMPQKKAPVTLHRARARGDKGRIVSAPPPPPPAVVDPAPRHWPEGASALGAVQPSMDRQLWWKLPPPSWSPFPHATTNQP